MEGSLHLQSDPRSAARPREPRSSAPSPRTSTAPAPPSPHSPEQRWVTLTRTLEREVGDAETKRDRLILAMVLGVMRHHARVTEPLTAELMDQLEALTHEIKTVSPLPSELWAMLPEELKPSETRAAVTLVGIVLAAFGPPTRLIPDLDNEVKSIGRNLRTASKPRDKRRVLNTMFDGILTIVI